MAKKNTRKNLWVIFATPEQIGRRDNLFFAKDGTKTTSRSRAAKFPSHEAADIFAKANGINLDGAMRYIHLLDFDESELRG